MLNFTAVAPSKWKVGLISCMLSIAKTVCSNEHTFLSEVSNLKTIFLKNNYPKEFFENVYKRFKEKQALSAVRDLDREVSGITFKVPFIGEASFKFSKQVTNLIKTKYNISVLPVNTTSKVEDYFSLKSVTPRSLRSNVVYKFSCLQDANLTYIGQSKRHLITRVGKHTSLGKIGPQSEIKNHIYDCQECHSVKITCENFEILKSHRDSFAAKISEALCIRRSKPRLNKKLFGRGVSYLLKIFQNGRLF